MKPGGDRGNGSTLKLQKVVTEGKVTEGKGKPLQNKWIGGKVYTGIFQKTRTEISVMKFCVQKRKRFSAPCADFFPP